MCRGREGEGRGEGDRTSVVMRKGQERRRLVGPRWAVATIRGAGSQVVWSARRRSATKWGGPGSGGIGGAVGWWEGGDEVACEG